MEHIRPIIAVMLSALLCGCTPAAGSSSRKIKVLNRLNSRRKADSRSVRRYLHSPAG